MNILHYPLIKHFIWMLFQGVLGTIARLLTSPLRLWWSETQFRRREGDVGETVAVWVGLYCTFQSATANFCVTVYPHQSLPDSWFRGGCAL